MISIILPSYKEPRVYETLRVTRELFPDAQVIIAPDDKGQGKGWAVHKGICAAEGDILVFIDADLDIHPRMIKRLLPFLEDYDIVVGTKTFKGMRWSRKLITLLSRIYIKLVFWFDCDSQSGLKAIRKDALCSWKTPRFMFDLEFLVKAKKRGLKIIEIPIDARVIRSKSLKVLWLALWDTLKIKWRLMWNSN